MMAHYYSLHNKSTAKKEFSDLHSTVLFLSRDALPRGIIRVVEVPKLKIGYDLASGKIILRRTKPSDKIQNFYSSKSFESLLTPLREAICAYARLDLLLRIARLEDEAISRFIHDKHCQADNMINITLSHLNTTLLRIQNNAHQSIIISLFRAKQLSLTHGAVRAALMHHGIHKINCGNDVDTVMQRIKQSLASEQILSSIKQG